MGELGPGAAVDRRVSTHRVRIFCSLALALLCSGLVGTASAEDPWSELALARQAIERYAWTADFVQTFVPAGFSSGEREAGRVSLQLPGMLRWDYELPYEKSFLIRGATAFSWNADELSGRKALLEAEDLNHLALLELDIATLRARYRAELSQAAGGGVEIALVPIEPGHEIRDAHLRIDATSYQLLTVRYSDVEGNTTEFQLSGHRVAAEDSLFLPPADIDWIDR